MSGRAAPEVLFSAVEIADRVEAMADAIVADLGETMIAVPILTGAFVFAADLVRALWHRGADLSVMPIRLRSYGASLSAESRPVLAMPLDTRIDGRAVLLIDGVCDVGHTLEAAIAHVRDRGAARVATAVMIDKPVRRAAAVTPDHAGFRIEDLFVVGYGMDAGGTLRHLPYIGVVR